jgi:hypothetical protein
MTGGKTMKTIQKFYEIEKTNGTNAKKEVLKKYSEDVQFKIEFEHLFSSSYILYDWRKNDENDTKIL